MDYSNLGVLNHKDIRHGPGSAYSEQANRLCKSLRGDGSVIVVRPYGLSANMIMTIPVAKNPGGAKILKRDYGIHSTTIDTEFAEELRRIARNARERAARKGKRQCAALFSTVVYFDQMGMSSSSHAVVILIVTDSAASSTRWAYYDPHGMHSTGTAQARKWVSRHFDDDVPELTIGGIRGRSGEQGLQHGLSLCKYYTLFAVDQIARAGASAIANTLSMLHSRDFVMDMHHDGTMAAWVRKCLSDGHEPLKVGQRVKRLNITATVVCNGNLSVNTGPVRIGRVRNFKDDTYTIEYTDGTQEGAVDFTMVVAKI